MSREKKLQRQELMEELARLGDSFPRVKHRSTILIAEATKLANARADVADLASRSYPVSDATFDRLDALIDLLRDAEIKQRRALDTRMKKNAAAQVARTRLIDVSANIARVMQASHVALELMSVDTTRIDHLLEDTTQLILRARESWESLFDKERLQALTVEAETLIKQNHALRAEARDLSAERALATQTAERARRLLFVTLRTISQLGLAAYPGDLRREHLYSLDRFIPKKAKKAEAPSTTREGGAT